MSKQHNFDEAPSLRYLGLPPGYSPSPKEDPISFLSKHITQLPPHILEHFSLITTPRQRTAITIIRNRRLKWTLGGPKELSLDHGINSWPGLWQGALRPGVEEARDEKEWTMAKFLDGAGMQIGRLGDLLGDYEEERENERVRVLRRVQQDQEIVPEEDEDTDEEEEEGESPPPHSDSESEPESTSEREENFQRRIRERFIYGLLEGIDYAKVDWDESLDPDNDQEAEERWFDDDES
ncbi:hypothetical protein BKA70DRAFT_1420075 [Coprinopsis sp. MPI-PUGE-AT-0042]|nr:hypothetical protein BKA70DRAFT_1420075 [Coprinopsis sp. MPI-PUGE-AT-0042]